MAAGRLAEALAGGCTSAFRRCLGKTLLGSQMPEPCDEVVDLLAELKITPRQLRALHKTFLRLKHYEPLTMTVGPDEVSIPSVVRLVKTKREWTRTILVTLLEIAGFVGVVNWDGFLYALLQFCTLSKIELAQVMFFIIARQMKSWTLQYLTSSQLADFYDDFHDCPVQAFNTKGIDFARLAVARYNMTDYIEFVYRFSQCINPCVHLQRSLRQALPSMSFWADYDRISPRSRRITIDFFHYRKVTSMLELVAAAARLEDEDSSLVRKPVLPDSMLRFLPGLEPWANFEADAESFAAEAQAAAAESEAAPFAKGCVPMPRSLYGPERAARKFPPKGPALPVWLQEQVMQNEDPDKETALGSAAYISPRGEKRPWWNAGQAPKSVEAAKAAIMQSHGHVSQARALPKSSSKRLWGQAEPEDRPEKTEAIHRNQELEFIRKARTKTIKYDNLVSVMERHCTCELIPRPWQNERRVVTAR